MSRISLLLLVSMMGGCSPPKDIPLEELPPFEDGTFKSAPYIRAAAALQALGRKRACRQMMAWAKRDRNAEQLFVLCRMLFTRRGASEFRRPMIGGAVFLAGTTYNDWRLEPIELVDGVPFVIVRGHMLAGQPESPESYFEYCMANCDWSTFQYREQTPSQMRAALAKLLASPKWKRPLDQHEREGLEKQVE